MYLEKWCGSRNHPFCAVEVSHHKTYSNATIHTVPFLKFHALYDHVFIDVDTKTDLKRNKLTLGTTDGNSEGTEVGILDGITDGITLGVTEGTTDGVVLGIVVGTVEGTTLGILLGTMLGNTLEITKIESF